MKENIRKLHEIFASADVPQNYLVILFILVIYLAGFNSLLSFLLQAALENVLMNGSLGSLVFACSGLLLSCFIFILFTYQVGVYKEKVFQKVAFSLKNRAFRGFLCLPYVEAEKTTGGKILTNIVDDCDECAAYFTNVLLPVIQMLFSILIGLCYAFLKSYLIGLFLVFIIPILYAMNRAFLRRIELSFISYQKTEELQKSFYGEVYTNIGIIKVYQLFKRILARDEALFLRKYEAAKRRAALTSAMNTMMEGGVMFLELFVISIGIFIINEGHLNVAALIGIWNAGIGSVVYPAMELPDIMARVVEQGVSHQRIDYIVDDGVDDDLSFAGGMNRNTQDSVLSVDNVSYRYDERADTFPVKGISFECRRGDIVCLLGESGMGKTTLGKIILGLYPPETGIVKIMGRGGIVTGSDLSSLISYVPQNNVLFNFSIAENIALDNKFVKSDDIRQAAKAVGIDNFVNSLPNRYGTMLLHDQNISGGEAQKICLARAFIKSSPFILCDEPTSSLDPESKRSVLSALREMSRQSGVMIITHDPDAASIATQVINMPGRSKSW